MCLLRTSSSSSSRSESSGSDEKTSFSTAFLIESVFLLRILMECIHQFYQNEFFVEHKKHKDYGLNDSKIEKFIEVIN